MYVQVNYYTGFNTDNYQFTESLALADSESIRTSISKLDPEDKSHKEIIDKTLMSLSKLL